MSKELDTASFLGRGWSFPVRFDSSQSSLEMVEMDQDVRESLIVLLSTHPGERSVNPDFGCPVRDVIYGTISPTTATILQDIVRKSVERFEPRIELHEVVVTFDELDGIIFVHLDYTIRRVNMRTNIVYPFYKLEGTEIRDI
jgi:phage baseplate assembly protein W